jgi:hypothetical protein
VRQLQQQAKEAATKNAETLHQLDEAHKIKDMMEAQVCRHPRLYQII